MSSQFPAFILWKMGASRLGRKNMLGALRSRLNLGSWEACSKILGELEDFGDNRLTLLPGPAEPGLKEWKVALQTYFKIL